MALLFHASSGDFQTFGFLNSFSTDVFCLLRCHFKGLGEKKIISKYMKIYGLSPGLIINILNLSKDS